jgi:DNA (cytosine-5)-methyltransferase 1
MSSLIKILELFGGIGSPRCALRNLGIPVKSIDYVEIDEKAVRSYNAIFENELPYKTQTVVNWNLKPDILIHGSPCQDFSIAGKQQGADEGTETRSSLMWETIRIIKNMGVWKPRIVIWENVKNVRSKYMRHNHDRYINELAKMGYTSTFKLLNAMDYGLPQKRERYFTVSCLNGLCFNFEAMEHKQIREIKQYLEDDVDDDFYTVKAPSMVKAIGKTGILQRLPIIKDYCYTITTRPDRAPGSGCLPIGGGQYRYLTERECWRLQGYTDSDFEAAAKVNSRRALYKQAGNSIPVTIFESMFEAMMNGGFYNENTLFRGCENE